MEFLKDEKTMQAAVQTSEVQRKMKARDLAIKTSHVASGWGSTRNSKLYLPRTHSEVIWLLKSDSQGGQA